MHALLGLSSVLVVVLGGYLALGMLRRLGEGSRRRDLQLVVLAAPVGSLGVGIGGLHHFMGRTCFVGAPPWDYVLAVALPLGMGLVALGGLGLGVVRLVLMYGVVARRGMPAGPRLQALADHLAERLRAPRPRVMLCASHRPLALACGLRRPTLLLSTWMVDHLDRRELESVVAHELGHVARRDYLVIWLATVLRDAFFYLPTSQAVYRQLQHEKELVCDDLAVGATDRPLALASALAKVWQQAIDGPTFDAAQPLAGARESMEGRIERLLTAPRSVISNPPPRGRAPGVGISALAGLLTLEGANLTVMLAPMGCGLISVLGTLF